MCHELHWDGQHDELVQPPCEQHDEQVQHVQQEPPYGGQLELLCDEALVPLYDVQLEHGELIHVPHGGVELHVHHEQHDQHGQQLERRPLDEQDDWVRVVVHTRLQLGQVLYKLGQHCREQELHDPHCI